VDVFLQKHPVGVQDIVQAEGPTGLVVALSTLGYAGIRLQDALEGSPRVDDRWRLDKHQMAAASGSYISLREALSLPSNTFLHQSSDDVGMLGDIPSARGDISLLELVQEGFPIDVMAAVTSGRGNEDREIESSTTLSSFIEQRLPKWAYIDGHSARPEGKSARGTKNSASVRGGIDVWYYLVAARPFHAFHLLMRTGPAQAMPPPSHVPHLEALLPALPQSLLSRPLQHRIQATLSATEMAYFQR
jgi:hypothetical protein